MILDRPPVKAVSMLMYEAPLDAIEELGARADMQMIILRSASKRVFSGGADIRDMRSIVGRRAQIARAAADGGARGFTRGCGRSLSRRSQLSTDLRSVPVLSSLRAARFGTRAHVHASD